MQFTSRLILGFVVLLGTVPMANAGDDATCCQEVRQNSANVCCQMSCCQKSTVDTVSSCCHVSAAQSMGDFVGHQHSEDSDCPCCPGSCCIVNAPVIAFAASHPKVVSFDAVDMLVISDDQFASRSDLPLLPPPKVILAV